MSLESLKLHAAIAKMSKSANGQHMPRQIDLLLVLRKAGLIKFVRKEPNARIYRALRDIVFTNKGHELQVSINNRQFIEFNTNDKILRTHYK